MRLIVISDTHRFEHPDLPDGDVLIHCGDGTFNGGMHETLWWLNYLGKQKHRYKVFIAGNHDWGFVSSPHLFREEALARGLTYLENEGMVIGGLKFWGSPVQPHFYGWAFQKSRGKELADHWAQIPDDTDILITHGPPYGFGDTNQRDERFGDEDLLKRVLEVKPQFHLYGHAHDGYGIRHFEGITFVNACSLTEDYTYGNPPVVLDTDG